MELVDKQKPHTQKAGTQTFAAVAGQSLRIETSPAGNEILEATVPAGKVWSVSIIVDITETDA